MSAGQHETRPFTNERHHLDTLVWRGVTNGLPAPRWVPLVDVDESQVVAVLAALAAPRVATHAEPTSTRPRARAGRRWRLWVDALAYARAEAVVRAEMSEHAPRHQRGNGQVDGPPTGR